MEIEQLHPARARAFHDVASEDPGQVLVALDFDGTLSEVVDDPERAVIHPDAAAALAGLLTRVGHVAIITGRPVDQVVRLGGFDDDVLRRLVVLGQYGAERLDHGGRHVPEPPEAVRRAWSELQPLADEYPGLFLEDKRQAVGVHTRRAAPGTLAAVEDRVREVARRHGLLVEPGKEVLELRAHRVSKGEALRGLVAETGARAVAMVGDDLGDLPAFDVIAELQRDGEPALAVVSGSDERPELRDRADVWCPGPAGVARWLGSVAPDQELS
ncbi:trehalose-phosphatase [uncultured Tessaracoccus sp.]|uniref:trehalose-phosphatase n=1 Tax=uncultured Tessaracoccus sp. TaxID=905023 RepID=UPI0025DD8314|nr:trehalose-phosphatase [uncultured Tessaracoccus sp.]